MELIQKEIQIQFKKTDAIVLIQCLSSSKDETCRDLVDLLKEGFNL